MAKSAIEMKDEPGRRMVAERRKAGRRNEIMASAKNIAANEAGSSNGLC